MDAYTELICIQVLFFTLRRGEEKEGGEGRVKINLIFHHLFIGLFLFFFVSPSCQSRTLHGPTRHGDRLN